MYLDCLSDNITKPLVFEVFDYCFRFTQKCTFRLDLKDEVLPTEAHLWNLHSENIHKTDPMLTVCHFLFICLSLLDQEPVNKYAKYINDMFESTFILFYSAFIKQEEELH